MRPITGHQGKHQKEEIIEVSPITGFRPEALAEILTEVDSFIYPALFDGAPSKADLLAKLARLDESPLAEEHWLVASMESGDGERIPVGICVRQRRRLRPAGEGWREMGLSSASKDACERYLGHIFEDTGDDRTYIMAIATLPSFRRRGVASILIDEAIDPDRPAFLDVLASNDSAIRLYESFGFCVYDEVDGYAYDQPAPHVLRMRRAALDTRINRRA
jgi:ribosomal protein S18 acetylase RimI-like enzyme